VADHPLDYASPAPKPPWWRRWWVVLAISIAAFVVLAFAIIFALIALNILQP